MKRNPNIKPWYCTRLMCKTLALLCILQVMSLPLAAQSYGIIGSVLTTDIKAYINGYEIPAYNVDGNMVIVGSDLRNYGFNVVYDNNTRSSRVTYDSNGTWNPIFVTTENDDSVGIKVMDVYDTDITVYVNGTPVTGYNVDGRMAFRFSELKMFGSYYYDNTSRTTNLWIEEKSYSQPSENYYDYRNASTTDTEMYSFSTPDDGSYSLGEKWIVDGQWEFTINNVEEHSLCDNTWNQNQGYSNETVVIIDYSYENLGYQGTIMDLYINDLKVYDSQGEAGEKYYGCDHAGGQKECIIGTKCSNAKIAFVLFNSSSNIKVALKKYASDGTGYHEVVYSVPVNSIWSDDTSERNTDSLSTNTPSMTQLNSFVSFFNLGIKSHSGVFKCLTGYVKYGSDSYIQLLYSNLEAAYRNFSEALSISERYTDMDDITDDMEKLIKTINKIREGSYTATEIADLLEPNQSRFEDILDEVKIISNY